LQNLSRVASQAVPPPSGETLLAVSRQFSLLLLGVNAKGDDRGRTELVMLPFILTLLVWLSTVCWRETMKAKQLGMLAGISALLVGISIQPAPATAQGFELEFGERGMRIERPDNYDRRYDRRERRRYERSGCGPREAVSAASRYLNDPYINAENRNYYYIDGYGKRGGARNRPDSVMISKAPGCPRV
jgi:hypothetical protein